MMDSLVIILLIFIVCLLFYVHIELKELLKINRELLEVKKNEHVEK